MRAHPQDPGKLSQPFLPFAFGHLVLAWNVLSFMLPTDNISDFSFQLKAFSGYSEIGPGLQRLLRGERGLLTNAVLN